MAYFLDLFSPETYEAFSRSDRSISGFRERHRGIAGRVKPGDKFLCYMTKLSRWVGVLEVLQGPYEDSRPLFVPDKDPFVIRFRVRPAVWLAVDKGVPIHEDAVWNELSFTRDQFVDMDWKVARQLGPILRPRWRLLGFSDRVSG